MACAFIHRTLALSSNQITCDEILRESFLYSADHIMIRIFYLNNTTAFSKVVSTPQAKGTPTANHAAITNNGLEA